MTHGFCQRLALIVAESIHRWRILWLFPLTFEVQIPKDLNSVKKTN